MQGWEEKKIDQATAHVHIGLHWIIRQRDVTLITVTPLAYTKPLKTIVTNQVNNEMWKFIHLKYFQQPLVSLIIA